MPPKKRARKDPEPSVDIEDIRKSKAKLAKWLPGGEKGPQAQQTQQPEIQHEPQTQQPDKPTEATEQTAKKI